MTSKEGAGRWVLVVDDDPDIRESVCELLTDHGYKVTTSADGAEALRLLRRGSQHPDLVLLDLRMPRCSGWEVLDALQKEPLPSTLRIVIVSADLTTNPPGVAARMAKPVAPGDLLDAVRRHVQARPG